MTFWAWIVFLALVILVNTKAFTSYFISKIEKSKAQVDDSKEDGYSPYGQRGHNRNSNEDYKIEKMRLSRRIVNIGFAALLVLSIACSSFYKLDEHHEASVVTFGKASIITNKGVNFRLPIFSTLELVDTTTQGMSIGYSGSDEKNTQQIPEESIMITVDFNIVSIDFYFEYHVVDTYAYLYEKDDPVGIFKNLALGSIRDTVGIFGIDQVLTDGKKEIEDNIRSLMNQKLDKIKIGIALTAVRLQDAEPPVQKVMDAFSDVENAKQEKEKTMNQAIEDKTKALATAASDADSVIKSAEAQKEERINEATQTIQLFNSMYEEYKLHPEMTMLRMYNDTLVQVLPNLKMIIGAGENVNQILPLDSFNKEGVAK